MARHYCVYCSRKRDVKFLFKIWINIIKSNVWLCKEHYNDFHLLRRSTAVDVPPLGSGAFTIVCENLEIDYFNE